MHLKSVLVDVFNDTSFKRCPPSGFSLCSVGRYAPFSVSADDASREGIQHPVIGFSAAGGLGLPPLALDQGSKIPATSLALFNRGEKRATVGVAKCRTGRGGTRRPTQRGTPPVGSGTAVGTVPARSDAEVGSPDRKDRGAKNRMRRSG